MQKEKKLDYLEGLAIVDEDGFIEAVGAGSFVPPMAIYGKGTMFNNKLLKLRKSKVMKVEIRFKK
jgi:hypothetical protein